MRAFALAAAGYLPKKEFQAQLEMGLARIAFQGDAMAGCGTNLP